MNVATKIKTIAIIDRCALFFFAVMIFLLPISNAAIEINFGFIFLCFLVKAVLLKPDLAAVKKFFSNRVNLSLLIFYICIGLSMIAAGPLWQKSFKAWFFKWGEGVLLFYFAQVFLKKEHLRIFAAVVLASGFLLSLDGIYQKITGVDFLRGFALMPGDGGFLGVRASFNHYNGFAAFLIVVFFIIIGYIMDIRTNRVKNIILIVPILILINLLFAFSRGAWVSFLTVAVLFLFFTPSKKKQMVLLGFFLFFILCVIGTPVFRERFFLIFKSGGDADRFRVWQAAINMFKDSPLLGKGIGLFMSFFREYSSKMIIQYAHNCYIQILAETGLAGLLSFFWFLSELIAQAYRAILKKQGFLFMGFLAAFMAFLIHMFFDTHLYSLNLSMLFWTIAAFLQISSKESLTVSSPTKV